MARALNSALVTFHALFVDSQCCYQQTTVEIIKLRALKRVHAREPTVNSRPQLSTSPMPVVLACSLQIRIIAYGREGIRGSIPYGRHIDDRLPRQTHYTIRYHSASQYLGKPTELPAYLTGASSFSDYRCRRARYRTQPRTRGATALRVESSYAHIKNVRCVADNINSVTAGTTSSKRRCEALHLYRSQ